jgi:hypothetical protein
MVSLFYGERGSGKTQRMVSDANEFAKKANGNIIYLDRDFNRIHDVVRDIRLVNVFDYSIYTDTELIAFIKGLIAGNSDIQKIYIDSIAKLTDKDINDLEWMFVEMEKLHNSFGVDFALTVEGTRESLPVYLHKYLNE